MWALGPWNDWQNAFITWRVSWNAKLVSDQEQKHITFDVSFSFNDTGEWEGEGACDQMLELKVAKFSVNLPKN